MPRFHSRRLAWLLVAGGSLLLAVSLYRLLQPAVPAPRPASRTARSVLLVSLDTTRADHLEPYGAEGVATPNLARLAARAVTFERAYSVAPITLVAHTSIHTGLDPTRHGVRNNGLHYVPEEVTTLAEQLQSAGYATAAFVSAAVLERRYGLDQGFDLYDDDLSAGRERHPRMVQDRPAGATVDAARAWLDTLSGDRPFFLWVHLYDPHAAYSPPPPYRDIYRERLYDGEIAYMDAEIGRLLAHPRLGEETLVAVIGDHGESLGEHGEQTHALLAYDATLRVPFFLAVPGGRRGMRVRWPVSQVDLMPTLLDLLGLDPPEESSGRSLVPLLDGRRIAADRPLYAETYLPYYTYGWAKLHVLRRGRYKWIDAPKPELYDLQRDPHELADLSEQEPGLAHDLSRDLAEYLAAHGDGERETALAVDSESRERLRALGYLAAGSGPPRREGPRPDPKDMVELHVGLERARFLEQDRLFPQAAAELRSVLKRDPGNLAAMIDLAGVLADMGEVERAVQIAERAIQLDPAYPRLHLLLASLETRRGAGERALELIDEALRLDPRSLDARLRKALQLDRMKRHGEAQAVLEESLATDPDSPRLQAVYAQLVELRLGDVEAAEARLRAALERDPFLVLAWRLLGETLERSGRKLEAVEAYREGLKRQPDDAEVHAQLGLALARLGDATKAEIHLREALRLSAAARYDLRVALGGVLAEQGRFDEARAEYEKVLAERPRHPGALNNRAVALYQAGQLDEAREDLLDLVDRYPRNADAHNNLAAISVHQGRFADAAGHANRALELSPEMAEAWNNLGLARSGLGERKEARAAYEQALELSPEYWQARLNLGLLLGELGEHRAAAETLENVVRQVPQLPDAHLALGDLYAGPGGDPERARLHYNAFLRLAPDNARAGDVRQRIAELE